MSKTRQELPKFRFLTTFALPALLIFLVPVLSFFFFRHAQGRFDAEMRESIKMSKFANKQEVLDAINRYYGRYLAAAQYQNQKKQQAGSGNQAAPQG